MENKINKLYELDEETRNLQEEVLKDFINKAKNPTILEFLEELLDNQYDTPRLNDLLDEINKLKLYTLDINSKVPKNFHEEFVYYYGIDYNEDSLAKLIFTINDDSIIEDIEYYTV